LRPVALKTRPALGAKNQEFGRAWAEIFFVAAARGFALVFFRPFFMVALKDPIKRWPRAKRREKSGLRPRIGAPEGWLTCTPGSFWRQVKKKPGTSKAKSEARNSNFEARNKFK
jgi:hypothetical protein